MEALPAYLTAILIAILLTSFVKILTTLSILRFGIGLHGIGFGVVVVGVSLALSLLVMHPQIEKAGGVDALLGATSGVNAKQLEISFKPFVDKHTDPKVKGRFSELATKISAGEEALESEPFGVSIAAFVVSELKEAFVLGFMILIPFVVIDLLVANVLMTLGVTQMSHAVVSLPLKILLFFALDGWALVSEKLVSSYI